MRPAFLGLLTLVATAAPAHAAMSVHHDLCSLALVSDAVILARRGAERPLDPYLRVRAYRVTRSLSGPLKPGQTVEVSDQGYALRSTTRVPLGRPGEEALLFLHRVPDGRGGPWFITPSGLRVTFQGKVYRFEQDSNPGPYVPVLQGQDPDDVRFGRAANLAGITLSQLVPVVQRALGCATRFREALTLTDSQRRLADIVALLPPHQNRLAPAPSVGFYEDLLVDRAIQRMLQHADVDAALEVLSRTMGLRPHLHANGRFPLREALLTRAESSATPKHRRVEALVSLFDDGGPPSMETMKRVTTLLTDRNPQVRAAAALCIERLSHISWGASSGKASRGHARFRVLLRDRLSRARTAESDAVVRRHLLAAAGAWKLGLR